MEEQEIPKRIQRIMERTGKTYEEVKKELGNRFGEGRKHGKGGFKGNPERARELAKLSAEARRKKKQS